MPDVVYLVRDLLFTSKIRETATQLGRQVASARDVDALVEAARHATVVILDLRLAEALPALDRLSADEQARRTRSIGFIDHEKVDVMESARARGCEHVLAKGKFSTDLPKLLTALFADAAMSVAREPG